jgi:hypothetical protein
MFNKCAALLMALPLSANAAPVTFARDIAPIVYQYCAPCHRPGEAGPFSLLSYAEVKSHARQIADVTRRRYMPPWAPESGYGDFSGARRLPNGSARARRRECGRRRRRSPILERAGNSGRRI